MIAITVYHHDQDHDHRYQDHDHHYQDRLLIYNYAE